VPNLKKFCAFWAFKTTIIVGGQDMNLEIDSFPTKKELELTGTHIKRIRERLGLSQEEFARKVGVARNTIASWELEKQKPSSMALKILYDIFYSIKKQARDLKTLEYF